jgi:hypothetical protein
MCEMCGYSHGLIKSVVNIFIVIIFIAGLLILGGFLYSSTGVADGAKYNTTDLSFLQAVSLMPPHIYFTCMVLFLAIMLGISLGIVVNLWNEIILLFKEMTRELFKKPKFK